MNKNLTKNPENCAALAVIRSMHKNGFYRWNIRTIGNSITHIYIHSDADGFETDIPEETKSLIADMVFETEVVKNPITHEGIYCIDDCVCFSVITFWDYEEPKERYTIEEFEGWDTGKWLEPEEPEEPEDEDEEDEDEDEDEDGYTAEDEYWDTEYEKKSDPTYWE